ncbi:MAG: DUF58 domain-containing protein [Gemmatimonadaceae bacterium]|nr:DUF58 domain-containing protein [Gemmatimonadaceae bacterium]
MAIATFAPVLDAVRGIAWPALRRVRSSIPGPHVSVVRGSTDEFVEYRPYRQGDDPKKIDWKLVGRTDRVYIRVSQERAILPTMILLDATASMAFPTATHAKWDLARRIGIALAAVARHRGDPVGMTIVHPERARTFEPRTRRTVLEEMMRAVEIAAGGSLPLAPATVDAMRRSARVVLISDFLGDADALLSAGRTFAAAGNELHAVHIVDEGELEPDPRKLLLADPEQPETRRPMSPPARAIYLRRFGAWREQLARDWRGAGASYVLAVTGQEPLRRTIRRITNPETGARRSSG